MVDYMQELDGTIDKNKDGLERLKGNKFSSWESQDFAWRWSSEKVTVKVKDELLRVPMNYIKLIKT